MDLNSLENLFVAELKDLYSAEKQITEALPKLAEKAETPDLRQAFEQHLAQTEQQIKRLEAAFDSLDVSRREKTCKGMECLLEEGKEMADEATDPITRDAALISGAQRVEHYEISGYGTAVSFAHQLNYHDIAEQLQQTLDEEKETDELLSYIAENNVNNRAI